MTILITRSSIFIFACVTLPNNKTLHGRCHAKNEATNAGGMPTQR
jgi:hypothetical protein